MAQGQPEVVRAGASLAGSVRGGGLRLDLKVAAGKSCRRWVTAAAASASRPRGIVLEELLSQVLFMAEGYGSISRSQREDMQDAGNM